MVSVNDLAQAARSAARALALAPAGQKTAALQAMAQAIRANSAEILTKNAKDLAAASSLSGPLRDRLLLDDKRIEAMAAGIEVVAALPDPVGKVLTEWTRPNGMTIRRVAVPLGVIGIIYESRPNVTADAGALCLRAGNACILRGGSESFHSSMAIHQALQQGLREASLPGEAIQMVPSTDRALVGDMLKAAGLIDVIVPRGGKSLVARVQEESRVPVFAHLDGNNHVYVHAKADPDMAGKILLNAKLRRTSICGAAETLLIDKGFSGAASLVKALLDRDCAVRGDGVICSLDPRVTPATEEDWSTEYLDAIMAARSVEDVGAAIAHINRYGSHHTDCIVTADEGAAQKFLSEVDSAIVLHNASTQFADGGEFGFGAEIGIATGRLHARGPVGAEQLTTYKYCISGNGQIRS